MENKIGAYEVSVELNDIKNLLFLMGDDFENIQIEAIKYKKQQDNLLDHTASRNIDRLATLQKIILEKVLILEELNKNEA